MVPFKPKEWAGVTAVGLALSFANNKFTAMAKSPTDHMKAMLVGGALLYVVGVRIGASRPSSGW